MRKLTMGLAAMVMTGATASAATLTLADIGRGRIIGPLPIGEHEVTLLPRAVSLSRDILHLHHPFDGRLRSNANGLGVRVPDDEEDVGRLDGRSDDELVLFNFSAPMAVSAIHFRAVDAKDDFVAFALDEHEDVAGLIPYTRYEIEQVGDPDDKWGRYIFDTPLVGRTLGVAATQNNDNFRIYVIEATPAVIPLPAAGALLLTGLAGLAALSRRRRA